MTLPHLATNPDLVKRDEQLTGVWSRGVMFARDSLGEGGKSRFQPWDYGNPEVFHSQPQTWCVVWQSTPPSLARPGPSPVWSPSPGLGLGSPTVPESLCGEPEPTWGSDTAEKT